MLKIKEKILVTKQSFEGKNKSYFKDVSLEISDYECNTITIDKSNCTGISIYT